MSNEADYRLTIYSDRGVESTTYHPTREAAEGAAEDAYEAAEGERIIHGEIVFVGIDQ